VLYQDDPFGRELLAGFQRGIQERKLATVAMASYNRQDMKLDAAVTQIAAAGPQAVLMACTPKACAQFVKEMRSKGQHPQFVTVSNVNSQDFFTALSSDCGGVAISQVVPHPGNVGVPVVQEFHLVRKSMETPPALNYAALEGFIGAKLLVEGLKKASDNPTPAKVAAALDSFKELDLGGLTISYTRHDRVGSRFVELTVLDRDCIIRR
jgi:ABC-type branched-subunit amino acid transport system substrate-binding protein